MGTKNVGGGDLFITQHARVRYNALDPLSKLQEENEEQDNGNEKSQTTLLLQKAQENLEAHAELQNKRKEFHERMQNIKEREKELQQKRAEFDEQVAKFAKFMSDNEEKRNRAGKRATEEIKNREILENDIKARITQIEQLKVQKEQARQTLAANALYQKYLEMVVETSEDFGNINEILSRYATLADANQDLVKMAEEHSKEVDNLRNELSTLIKEKQNEVLVLNSLIVEKKQQLEAKKNLVSRREQDMSLGVNTQQQRARTMGEIEMAIANLYSRLPMQYRHHKSGVTSAEQLEEVKEWIEDMQDIIAGNFAQSSKQAKDMKTTTYSSSAKRV